MKVQIAPITVLSQTLEPPQILSWRSDAKIIGAVEQKWPRLHGSRVGPHYIGKHLVIDSASALGILAIQLNRVGAKVGVRRGR